MNPGFGRCSERFTATPSGATGRSAGFAIRLSCLQEPCLVALEMMKFGILSGEPFEAAERPFPEQAERFHRLEDHLKWKFNILQTHVLFDFCLPRFFQVKYAKSPVDSHTKSLLLLSRVMSLVPMQLKSGMWNADVDFDLAAFHSLVRLATDLYQKRHSKIGIFQDEDS